MHIKDTCKYIGLWNELYTSSIVIFSLKKLISNFEGIKALQRINCVSFGHAMSVFYAT